ncbi:MAG: ANTAR domain-containing protein [Clostridiales bacterium]|nr:ANTAR domain-containing protein [Clostridiales bacterium]
MESVLLVSSIEKDTEKLGGYFKTQGFEVTAVSYASKARRVLLEKNFNLVVVNAPLSDEFGAELATNAAERTDAGVLLIVKSDLFSSTAEKAERAGVFVVEKPLQISLGETVRLMRAVFYRMTAARKENEKLQRKISETRLIERAKSALIRFEGMSEDNAHKFIERAAMDRRIPRGDVASEILAKYNE